MTVVPRLPTGVPEPGGRLSIAQGVSPGWMCRSLAMALALVLGGCPGPPRMDEARVEIDPARLGHRVSPLVFGMHLEWVADGNGLLDPVRPVLRTAVLDRLRPLGVPLFRFPGGIHADYYDWRLGVGPPPARRASRNVFTRKPERHRFGTPEFLALLEATGAEALITANYGTGTAAETGAWAEYLAAAGHPARYWEVGNEIYLSGPRADGPNGREIYHSPEEYARDFPRYRAAIRAAIPDALVGAIAHLDSGAFSLGAAENRDWTERMVPALAERADFIAVHNAYAPVILDDATNFASERQEREVYRALYAAAAQIRDNLDEVARTVARLSPIHDGVPIAVTELGPFFGLSARPGMHAAYVDQTRTLAAALYTASVLDVLIGDPRVLMGCYTNPIHRWYGSLITDDGGQRLVRTPTYHLYALYRSRFEPRLAAAEVTSPSFDSRRVGIVKARSGVPDLIARASVSEDGRRLTAMVVNRSLTRTLRTTVALGGFVPEAVDCLILTADEPDAISGPGLTASIRSGGEIVPRPFSCPAVSPMELVIPANAILSLVAEEGQEGQRE